MQKNTHLTLLPNNNDESVQVKQAEEEVLSQMLDSYTNRLMSRRLKPRYTESIIRTINSFVDYTNLYPWEWTPEDFDDWSANLYQVRKNGESTQRHKQNQIYHFQKFLVDSKQLSELCQIKFVSVK